MRWLSISAPLIAILGHAYFSSAAAVSTQSDTIVTPDDLCVLSKDAFLTWINNHKDYLTDDDGKDWSTNIETYCNQVRAYAGLEPFSSLVRTSLSRRGSPDAPAEYEPVPVPCPSNRPTIRDAADGTLSDSELAFLKTRRANSLSAYNDFLSRVAIPDFNATSYLATHTSSTDNNRIDNNPVIGIAASGGGYRAMLNGAGAIMALDGRTTNATSKGHVGGLLQSATYLSGLSGGSWLVGSLYSNNFTTVESIIAPGSSLWALSQNILEGPKGRFQALSTFQYMTDIIEAIKPKEDSSHGFNVSITDYWGRALSYQLINDPNAGVSYTWSSVANDADIKNGNIPMPIIVAIAIETGSRNITTNTSTVIEFNPWEIGSYDNTLGAFVPTKYIGSRFLGGKINSTTDCIAGFDNAGFIMGTSSSLFSVVASTFLSATSVPGLVSSFLTDISSDLTAENNDIADYTPNPFNGFTHADKSQPVFSSGNRLTMVDGGLDNQNIPLDPLLMVQRSVDVILAIDSSADTEYSWPNGSSLIYSANRNLFSPDNKGTHPMPPIPADFNTFINQKLNTRPTFFGCDLAQSTVKLTSGQSAVAPLIVYIPNSPYSFMSNTSTLKMSYTDAERNGLVYNGYDVVTQANSTLDANWPVCLACATLSRSFSRTNTTVPAACTACFQNYCWDGVSNSTTPSAYEPTAKFASATSGASRAGDSSIYMMVGMVTLLSILVV